MTRLAATAVVLIALCLSTTGCLPDTDGDGTVRIGVAGDSNTAAGWPTAGTVRWVELAAPARILTAAGMPAAWVEVAKGGATACDPGVAWPWGEPQRQQLVGAGADVLVLAFGTNDIQRRTPADIVACYQMLVAAAAPRPVYVALTPPMYGDYAAHESDIEALNALLLHAFPGRTIDFWTGFGPSLFEPDGLHLNLAGQELRAARALAVLR